MILIFINIKEEAFLRLQKSIIKSEEKKKHIYNDV